MRSAERLRLFNRFQRLPMPQWNRNAKLTEVFLLLPEFPRGTIGAIGENSQQVFRPGL